MEKYDRFFKSSEDEIRRYTLHYINLLTPKKDKMPKHRKVSNEGEMENLSTKENISRRLSGYTKNLTTSIFSERYKTEFINFVRSSPVVCEVLKSEIDSYPVYLQWKINQILSEAEEKLYSTKEQFTNIISNVDQSEVNQMDTNEDCKVDLDSNKELDLEDQSLSVRKSVKKKVSPGAARTVTTDMNGKSRITPKINRKSLKLSSRKSGQNSKKRVVEKVKKILTRGMKKRLTDTTGTITSPKLLKLSSSRTSQIPTNKKKARRSNKKTANNDVINEDGKTTKYEDCSDEDEIDVQNTNQRLPLKFFKAQLKTNKKQAKKDAIAKDETNTKCEDYSDSDEIGVKKTNKRLPLKYRFSTGQLKNKKKAGSPKKKKTKKDVFNVVETSGNEDYDGEDDVGVQITNKTLPFKCPRLTDDLRKELEASTEQLLMVKKLTTKKISKKDITRKVTKRNLVFPSARKTYRKSLRISPYSSSRIKSDKNKAGPSKRKTAKKDVIDKEGTTTRNGDYGSEDEIDIEETDENKEEFPSKKKTTKKEAIEIEATSTENENYGSEYEADMEDTDERLSSKGPLSLSQLNNLKTDQRKTSPPKKKSSKKEVINEVAITTGNGDSVTDQNKTSLPKRKTAKKEIINKVNTTENGDSETDQNEAGPSKRKTARKEVINKVAITTGNGDSSNDDEIDVDDINKRLSFKNSPSKSQIKSNETIKSPNTSKKEVGTMKRTSARKRCKSTGGRIENINRRSSLRISSHPAGYFQTKPAMIVYIQPIDKSIKKRNHNVVRKVPKAHEEDSIIPLRHSLPKAKRRKLYTPSL